MQYYIYLYFMRYNVSFYRKCAYTHFHAENTSAL